nr:MAG: ParB-like nuclease domain [Bacteriophage sp.]
MAFNIMDLMNGATRAAVEGVENYEEIRLNLEEIEVTKHNRYSMDELEELATSILMDGLQEPLIIGRVNGKYLLSGGHRRREALAKGGVLREGTAMVAEAGPELLSMVNGKAVVTPLTGSAVNTAADNLKGNNSGFHQEINITSPKALSPYEVARQTRIQTRAMVIAMQRG